MTLQRVKTDFYGRWIESFRYIDYRVVDVYDPCSSSFQEFIQCIQGRIFPYSDPFVCRVTLYWNGCNNSNLIRIVEDKEVYWLMLVILKFPNNDLVVVVDSIPTG